MVNQPQSSRWHVIGQKVTGAAHQQKNKPCQDSYKYYNKEVTVLAVADGHGSPNSPFSDIGALLAAISAVEICRDFYAKTKELGLTAIKRYAEEELPKLIVKEWVQRVEEHHLKNSTLRNDMKPLQGHSLLVKYGSTLLTALLCHEYLLFLQLGDGDILIVDGEGQVQQPIQRDPRLLGNETTSLCSPQAWKEMQTAFLTFHESPPRLILLSTDGYSNSYKSHEDFLKVAQDYDQLAQEHGVKLIENKLSEWLEEVSAQGSGDDITVCLAFQNDPPAPLNEVVPDEHQRPTGSGSSTTV